MTDLDNMALLPCPFCGGKPRTGTANSGVPGMEDCGYAYIECCDVHVHRDEDEECASDWNRRAALLTAPPGYVLVPVEPTPLMIATFRADNEHGALSWMTHTTLRCADFRSRYAGMLAAAPEVK